MKPNELYQATTDLIIKQLEEGVPPWCRPWRDSRVSGIGMIPSNLITGRCYSGSNILLLWLAAMMNGWDSLQFCTYHQVNSINARVKKGSKSVQVIFTKHITRKDEQTGDEKASTIVKLFPVFHVSQLEGVDDKYLHAQQPLDLEMPRMKVRDLVNNAGIDLRLGFNKACYIPSQDCIHMPAFGAFDDEAAFTSVLLHEATHWSGHETRLNRKIANRFASPEYSFEELIGELGSAFLCARLGYIPHTRSASYLASWLKVLKADNRAIFSAASYAGQASDYIWNLGLVEEQRDAAE